MNDREPLARKPGRPRKIAPTADSLPLISREMVIECSYQLCDTIRLEDISLKRLACELGVSQTTIRHHTKTGKALTAALIDRYYSEFRQKLIPITGEWTIDFENYLWAFMAMNLKKRGFTSYFFEHRFSPELVPFCSDNAGVVHRHILGILQAAGLNTMNAALAWHLTIHLLLSVAYAEARGQTPANQQSVFEIAGLADGALNSDRAVLAALRNVNLPMIYGVISNMLRHAIEVKFNFPEVPSSARKRRSALLDGAAPSARPEPSGGP